MTRLTVLDALTRAMCLSSSHANLLPSDKIGLACPYHRKRASDTLAQLARDFETDPIERIGAEIHRRSRPPGVAGPDVHSGHGVEGTPVDHRRVTGAS